MKITNLISAFADARVSGDPEREITGITFDSRKVERGFLFVAFHGTAADGHDFIPSAISAGAGAVVCEVMPDTLVEDVTYVRVKDSKKALGIIASSFFGNPSSELRVIGVTGTNGKTTIATLLYRVHMILGYKAGLLSTIEVLINNRHHEATHTTPDPVQLHRYMRQMADEGCEYCFMEVSSHAISQDRIAGICFAGGVFTNLTHEHLDYHGDFKNYLEAKKAFFDQLDSKAFALVNRDDKNSMVMLQNTKARKFTYSLNRMADFRGKIVEMHLDGTNLMVNGQDLWIRLPGKFNVSNILAVYGASVLSGDDPGEVLQAVSGLEPVRGRFETVTGREGITAIIDYAHTPDALLNVLETITEVNQRGAKLITVVGAGGNRDRTKRPGMAKVAFKYSDRVIFTSDNPRNEDPESIIREMMDGLTEKQRTSCLRIVNREEAIITASLLADPGDIILIAGKGHETYQEIMGKRYPFDDMEITRRHLI